MSSPLISVLITNHNYAQFLGECVQSVLAQTYQHIQVVVVDDGSTDGSLQLLHEFRDRIEVIQQTPAAGQWAALMAGTRACRGELICLLDADDYWLRHKVARVAEVFDANRQIGWLRHKLFVVGAGDAETPVQIPPFSGSRSQVPSLAAVNERVFMAITSALVLRADLVTSVLLQHAAPERWDADALLVARCAASRRPVYSLDEPLGVYRRHGHQQFTTNADMQRMLERQIQVGERVARELAVPAPVSNFKHQLINQSLAGQSRFHPHRMRTALRAFAHSARLLTQPNLFARQVGGVVLAAVAPNVWLARLRRRTGFPCG
jgi:glycosyltransferase involved in cell wall biosynthesis